MDETFASDVAECKAWAIEKVERVLYEKATDAEPWAVKTYLAAEDPDKYGTSRSVSVSVRGEFGGDDGMPLVERVRLMQEQLASRELAVRAGDVVDAEVVEVPSAGVEPAPPG